jgi:transcriptional regulator with XRE-family HTH domain
MVLIHGSAMSRASAPDQALAMALRRMRSERGITREALAFRSGITAGALARIELGQSAPGWDTVRMLARGLDISMVELSAAVEGRCPPVSSFAY